MPMKIIVRFDRRDDLAAEAKERILGGILTMAEASTAHWCGHSLTYRTSRDASAIIESWESEGFNIDEFELLSFEQAR